MPGSISLGLLVLGGVLILIGFLGGNFKLFGAEVAATISNRWLRFLAIIFGVVLLITAGLSSTPSNPSTTSSSPSISASSSLQSPETPSLDKFVGRWSSEGDVRASHLMTLEIQLQDGELSGTLESQSYKDRSSSGVLSIVSEDNEKPSSVEIFDQKGYAVGKAELELSKKALVWRLIRAQGIAEVSLPSISYLYQQQ